MNGEQIKYIEKDKDYASKGLVNGIGIPALTLGGLAFLNQGGLGGLGLGGNDKYATKESLALSNQMSEKDARIAALETQVVVDGKLTEIVTYVNNENKDIRQVAYENAAKVAVNEERFNCLKEQVYELRGDVKHNTNQINAQGIINQKLAGEIGCIQQQVALLDELWTPKIPARKICGNVRTA